MTLIGGGDLLSADLEEALSFAPTLVAADGGAARAMAAGHMPDCVIGDFDSLSDEEIRAIPADRRHPVDEQDSTDFEKCLIRIRAPLVLCVGFLGRRVDHQLAAMSALISRPSPPAILIGEKDVVFHAPETLELDLPVGSRLSLFPMSRVRGRSEGLEWPIDGLAFAPDGRIGTSNRVTGPVRLSFDGPGMLAIMPRAALAQAMRRLWRDPAP